MRKVLLAVCGLTPQVITETLYALHQQGRLPDAVRVITTREGREACLSRLLSESDGHFYRFLADYGIEPGRIDFAPRHIQAVTTAKGRQLDDITDEEENEFFLRACMESAFELTTDTECTVYFSIAGGRKTMGSCLSAAAQCYGRPGDRLFHVLVTPEFESSREFFYPPMPPQEIELRDRQGQPYRKNTRYAAVTLVPVPFVSIRDRLTPAHLKQPETPAALMASLVREEKPRLTVDLVAGKVLWKGIECDLQPSHLALYGFFARHKKGARCESRECRGCTACFLTLPEVMERQTAIADLYRQTAPMREAEAMSGTGILGLDAENFRSYRAKIRKTLERAFGPADADELEITTIDKRPSTRYGLKLERERVRVVL